MTSEIEKVNDKLVVVDPFQESIDSLIVVVFPKSNSPNFAFALNIALGASRYANTEIGGKPMHFAAFARTHADAGKAAALLNYVASWKGAMIFCRGKLIPSAYQVSQVINCYLESCSCRDSKAHCHTIIDDPFSKVIQHMSTSLTVQFVERPPLKQESEIDRYAFPCKYLFGWFRFQKGHPSSPQDQIQAAGVSRGCEICPHFNPDDFKIVGTRKVIEELFE